MDVSQIIRFFIYELTDLVPNLILAYIPFRNQLRLSKAKNILVSVLIYITLTLSRILAFEHLSISVFMTIFWIFLYTAFYRICFRSSIMKLIFVLLVLLNYNSFITIISCYFAYFQLEPYTQEIYTYTHALINLIVLLPTYPLVAYIFKKKIRPLIDFEEQQQIWNYLWLIPATFCLSYYFNLYSGGGVLSYAQQLGNVIFATFFNAGAFFVTYVITRLQEVSNDYLLLKTENYHLSLLSLQYDHQQQRIEDARRSSHDFRQSLTLIQTCMQENDYENLKGYLKKYMDTLKPTASIVYCSNYALNAVIVYYENLAKKHQIDFRVELEFPESTRVEDPDLVVLFGNLLENAVEACTRCKNQATFIALGVQCISSALVISLDNSFNGNWKTEDGILISSKGQKGGIGQSSIRNISEKYGGATQYDSHEKVFHTSVVLYI